MDCANELRLRTEKDFDNYRVTTYNQKRELNERANRMRDIQETTTIDVKTAIKNKFRAKMEAFEKVCTENMRRKIEEVELEMKENH